MKCGQKTDDVQLVRRALQGALGEHEIRAVVEDAWLAGCFVRRIPAELLPACALDNPARSRYCGSPEVAHHVLFGAPGQPGCVVVVAPPELRDQGDLQDLWVPLHSHSCEHLAVVLSGSGSFFVRRQLPDGPVLIEAPVETGSLLCYPRHTPHTFASGPRGICVASLQSRYEPPDSAGFARPYPDAQSLPRLSLQHAQPRLKAQPSKMPSRKGSGGPNQRL